MHVGAVEWLWPGDRTKIQIEIVGIHLKPKRRPKLRVPVFRMKIYASLKPNENLKKVCSAPPVLSILLFHTKCSIMQYNSNQDFIASERKKEK